MPQYLLIYHFILMGNVTTTNQVASWASRTKNILALPSIYIDYASSTWYSVPTQKVKHQSLNKIFK